MSPFLVGGHELAGAGLRASLGAEKGVGVEAIPAPSHRIKGGARASTVDRAAVHVDDLAGDCRGFFTCGWRLAWFERSHVTE